MLRLFFLFAAFFAPTGLVSQVQDPIMLEAARIMYGTDTADTARQGATIKEKYVLADTAKAIALTTTAVLNLLVRRFTEARAAAEQATAIFSALNVENEMTARAWNALAKTCYFTENYREALRASESLAAIRRKIYPENHPEIAKSYNDLGLLHGILGDKDKALELLLRSLELSLQQPDVCATDAGSVYTNIGNLYMDKSQCAKALEYFEKGYELAIQCKKESEWSIVSVYNQLGSAYGCLGQMQKEIGFLEKGAAFAERYGAPLNLIDLRNLITSLDNLGIVYNITGQLDKSDAFNQKALNLRLKSWPSNHIGISSSYNNLASNLMSRGDYKNAVSYLENALAELAKSAPGDAGKLAYYYNNLAVCHSNLGDNQRALELHEYALSLKLKAFGPDSPELSGTYHNLAATLSEMGEYDSALRYFDLAVAAVVKPYGEMRYEVAMFYNGIGSVHYRKGDLQKAAEYYRKAVAIMEQVFGEDNQNTANMLCNLGATYAPGGDLELATGNIRRGLAVGIRLHGPNSPNLATGYTVLGNVYQKAGRHAEAEDAFRSALAVLNGAMSDSLGDANTIGQRANTHLATGSFFLNRFRETPDPALLHRARKHYAEAVTALTRLSRTVSPGSKSVLASLAADICAGAIAAAHYLHERTDSLHYWHEAFGLAERSKAYLLFEAMKAADALHVAGIPDSLLLQERELRIGIAYCEKLLQENRDSMRADSTLLAIGSQGLDLKHRHENLIRRFETDYPEYYQAKYGFATATATEVQRMLLPGQTLLEYAVGDSSIFAFVVRSDHFSVHELPRDFPLEQTVDTLVRLGIYGFYTLPKAKRTRTAESTAVANYTRAAQLLYQKLIAPVKDELSEEVIIVPDGVLGYMPFEALLTGEPERSGVFATYEPLFLLNSHRISYCYSATLLREMRDKRHSEQPTTAVLALAPFFRGDTTTLFAHIDSTDKLAGVALRDVFGPLAASGDEAYTVAKLLGGTALYGTDATLDAFRRQAPQSRVLHLSTHGKADDRAGDYAYLALGVPGDTTAFDKLFARDLYALDLNADLVVLSACETATGKLRRGEGIVSLARAFSYAGTKSLVTSLWKVNDETTKDVMTYFYGHLHQGTAKDTALRQAKLDFLKNNRQKDGGATLHPFFWAGLVAVGDMRPLH